MAKETSSLKRKAATIGGWQVVKRVAKSIPYVGSAFAIGLVGYNVKKKGLVRGVVDSGLDAIPIVGTVKNVTEFFTGDFIPAKEETEINRTIKEHNANDDK